jgi:hypothetical protein
VLRLGVHYDKIISGILNPASQDGSRSSFRGKLHGLGIGLPRNNSILTSIGECVTRD